MHRSRRFTPWRAAADDCGLRTSCALPLVVDDLAIGALMIYAGDQGTFGPDEVDVLLDLADDFAYGIARLRDAKRLADNERLLERRNASLTSGTGNGTSRRGESTSWRTRCSLSTGSLPLSGTAPSSPFSSLCLRRIARP